MAAWLKIKPTISDFFYVLAINCYQFYLIVLSNKPSELFGFDLFSSIKMDRLAHASSQHKKG